MHKERAVIVLVVLLVVLAGVGIYFFNVKQQNGLSASGTIEATEVKVSSKISGKVAELLVKEGDVVKASQMIAKLDVPELEAQLRQARAGVDQAKASFENAQTNLARSQELFKKGFISQSQIDVADTQYKVAHEQYKNSKAVVDLVQAQLNNALITSPLDGIVTLKAIEQGEILLPGMTIVNVADLKNVWFMVYVPEKEIGKVFLGQEARVTVDSYPGEVFKGKIIFISQKAEFTPKNIQTREERVNQVFGVKVEIPNLNLKLKPGMPADADLQWK